jgi:hypothetical protein
VTVSDFLSHLKKVRKAAGGWMACCPSHDDASPSLLVSEGEDGRVLVLCYAGCTAEAIAAALGLNIRDLFAESRDRASGCTLDALARYCGVTVAQLSSYGLRNDVGRDAMPVVAIPYSGLDGAELRVKYRRRLTKSTDGEERFYWGSGAGNWPYGLWRLAATRAKGSLILTEGESDAWSLWAENVPALGIPGATQAKLLQAEHLAGIGRLWVTRDNDAAGEEFCTAIGERVAALGFQDPLRVIVPPQPHKDVTDWRKAEGAAFRQAFQLAAKAAKTLAELKSPLLWAHSIEVKPLRFALNPYIPKGYITMFAGKPGMGKTLITCALAAALTNGTPILGAMPEREGKAILFSTEDDPGQVLKPRLRQAGARLERVGIFDFDAEEFRLNGDGIKRLAMVIEKERPEIVILDPLVTFVSADVDMNQANEVRDVLRPLAQLAKQTETAILVVAHVKKGSAVQAIDSVIGSMDFMAAVRSAMITYRDPEGAKGMNQGVLAHVKHNLTAAGAGLRYEIRPSVDDALVPELLWRGRSRFTVEQLCAGDVDADEIEEATEFLRAELSSVGRPVELLRSRARQLGITDKNFHTARRRLGLALVRLESATGETEYTVGPYFPDFPEDIL